MSADKFVFRRYCRQRVNAYFVSHENILNEQLPRMSTRNALNVSGQENHENIPNKNLPRMSTRNSPNVSGQENINVVNVQGTAKNFQTARKPKVLNLPLKKPSPLTSMPNIY